VTALGGDLELSAVAVAMIPGTNLSDHFPGAPPENTLHVIVQAPHCKSSDQSHPLTEITDTFLYAVPSAGRKRGLPNDDTGGEPASKRTKRHSGSRSLS
jgi:hypothetical protein